MFGYTKFWKGLLISPFNHIKNKLDSWEIKEKNIAKKIVSLIPSQCPFAQDICVFDRKIVTIPPLCKLNPFYDNLMILRFKALCFLSEIGEDISPYC
ncbi:Mo-dependent nitrogenase C-terminal domain-containing protein [Geminocystis herdmanii]|uniref:Mo-dependent nitrogenase C-terminal domain-containing protein n=1 Tax=Geminocystis herdmanii TaxID=669359 RepID=UPI00034D6DFB|nr:Mo-dependent nitrogenase C-terminal domain-containing protein [Geminocystis herdmanii]